MKEQILIISVVIALMFLATMPTASSYVNESGKVWSDGYVELILNKIERTGTVPSEFLTSVFEEARPPRVGHDFVVINLTVTRIEGRYVLPPSSRSILFDDKGHSYKCGSVGGVVLRTEKGEIKETLTPAEFANASTEVIEGSKWLLLSEMPKNREPVRLRFFYNYTKSWGNISEKEGQIEINLQATSIPIPTLTPTSSPKPTSIATPVPLTPTSITPSPTATATEFPTPEKGVPGFEGIFAIMGLLAVAYLLRRRK